MSHILRSLLCLALSPFQQLPLLTCLCSVIITGVLRVAYGYKPGSQNVAFSKAELWSVVHVGIAIVCACLPTLRKLFVRTTTNASSFGHRRYFHTINSSSDGGIKSKFMSSNALSRLESQDSSKKLSDASVDTVQLTMVRKN